MQGANINTGEDVAIKLEHVSIDPSLLENEADTYRFLSGGVGIPRVHAYETECEYMLLYFLRGSLPWQGLTATDQTQKEELILEEKRRINTDDLCEDLPQEFAVYFDYIGSLDFDEKPKYSYLWY